MRDSDLTTVAAGVRSQRSKCVRRLLFNILVAASLALCVSTAVLWIESERAGPMFIQRKHNRQREIYLWSGVLSFVSVDDPTARYKLPDASQGWNYFGTTTRWGVPSSKWSAIQS